MSKMGHQMARLGGKLYVPICSVLLVLTFGNWLADRSYFDPVTVAQNQRIRFQKGDENIARLDGLTEFEAESANAVVRDGFKQSGNPNEIFFAGDSQTLAIMDEKPGDLTTPQWLQILLIRLARAANSPTIVLGSLPNMSMTEFLIRLVTAGEWTPNPVHAAVGCIVLREWRGLAVRESVRNAATAGTIRDALARLAASSPDLPSADAAISASIGREQSADRSSAAPKGRSFAVRLEQKFQDAADEMPLFRMRSYLYGRVFLFFMILRNRLLGIHTDTPRKVPETTYRASLQLLELSLRYARSRHIDFILYLAPNRPYEPNPILPSDLAKFRRDVRNLCERYDAPCFDYTNLVPEKLWTNYPAQDAVDQGGRDYLHFTGPAHKLVAEHISADAGARLIGSAP